jgi:cyclic-di-GMP-binding protein
MSDSNLPVIANAPPGPASATANGPAARVVPVPPLGFADAESAKRWANGLPLTNVGQVYEAVHGQLRALSAAAFPPRERATIAEVLRDQVAHLHTELARRYAGKPQPAVDRELEAADQALLLWQALWEQYSACLKPVLEGDPDLAGVKSKLLQRGLYVGKQLVLAHGLARRVPPPTLWQELHAYYRLAEMLECAVTAVSDDLMPNAIGISCYSTYSHALLLGLADLCSMSVKQIELTDRWLGMWARKVFPYAQQRETEGPIIVIDLDSPEGASLAVAAPQHPASSMRFGYPAKLATSVRGRLKRLQTGANPAELQLGHDCSVEQCTTLLGHLDAKWYQVPRRVPDATRSTIELCAGGIGAAYFRVGGRTFERKGAQDLMSFQGAQHLHTLVALTDYDRGREDAERTWEWERWTGTYESREASVARASGTRHRWALEQLVTVRDEERMRLGYLTRVARGVHDELSVSLRLWSGTPKALPLRPLSTAVAEEPSLPSLVLGETLEDKPSLILPPRSFNPSRVLRTLDAGRERRFRLTRLLQRGADFERVAFEETN